jgi:hypothetical protein
VNNVRDKANELNKFKIEAEKTSPISFVVGVVKPADDKNGVKVALAENKDGAFKDTFMALSDKDIIKKLLEED